VEGEHSAHVAPPSYGQGERVLTETAADVTHVIYRRGGAFYQEIRMPATEKYPKLLLRVRYDTSELTQVATRIALTTRRCGELQEPVGPFEEDMR
jgi:hypothetical protein